MMRLKEPGIYEGLIFMDTTFIPIETSDHKIIYQTCIGKSVYYFNIFGIWLIIGLDILFSILDGETPNIIAMFAVAIAYFWIAPSGTRRVYNKSKGSRTASNIACILCVWFSLIGWIVCWFYENW